jgi:hypothetical protein
MAQPNSIQFPLSIQARARFLKSEIRLQLQLVEIAEDESGRLASENRFFPRSSSLMPVASHEQLSVKADGVKKVAHLWRAEHSGSFRMAIL